MLSSYFLGLPVDDDLLPVQLGSKLLFLSSEHSNFIFIGLFNIRKSCEVGSLFVVELTQICSDNLWEGVMVRVLKLNRRIFLILIDHSLNVFHDSLF